MHHELIVLWQASKKADDLGNGGNEESSLPLPLAFVAEGKEPAWSMSTYKVKIEDETKR